MGKTTQRRMLESSSSSGPAIFAKSWLRIGRSWVPLGFRLGAFSRPSVWLVWNLGQSSFLRALFPAGPPVRQLPAPKSDVTPRRGFDGVRASSVKRESRKRREATGGPQVSGFLGFPGSEMVFLRSQTALTCSSVASKQWLSVSDYIL